MQCRFLAVGELLSPPALTSFIFDVRFRQRLSDQSYFKSNQIKSIFIYIAPFIHFKMQHKVLYKIKTRKYIYSKPPHINPGTHSNRQKHWHIHTQTHTHIHPHTHRRTRTHSHTHRLTVRKIKENIVVTWQGTEDLDEENTTYGGRPHREGSQPAATGSATMETTSTRRRQDLRI